MADSIYEGLEARWHDYFWETEELGLAEVGMMGEFLDEFAGRSLYVGSGSGRLWFPLLDRGYEVVGLEASAEMGRLCREKREGLELLGRSWDRYVSCASDEKWGSIVIPGFTFQLLENPLKVLRQARGLLDEGGGVYFTVFFPWAELTGTLPEGKWYEDREVELPDGTRGKLESRHRVLEKKRVLKRRHRYTQIGTNGEILAQEDTSQAIRWFVDGELEKMADLAGFRICREVEDFGHEGEEDEPVSILTCWFIAI